jgi:hypothetical protein
MAGRMSEKSLTDVWPNGSVSGQQLAELDLQRSLLTELQIAVDHEGLVC